MAHDKLPAIYGYRGKKENKNAVLSTQGSGHVYTYHPSNKSERDARRRVWDRYQKMKDSPLRAKAERRWDLGDKMYSMWSPDRDKDDWKADVILPDGFSAVQTHMQETIQLRPRPHIEGVESSDETLKMFKNHTFQYAMDKTDFDIETYKCRNVSAIRGDAYSIEEYRYETRKVKDIKSVKNGVIEYVEREIVDFDDVYTRFVDNWNVFTDDSVEDPKYGRDCIYREVLSHEDFIASYQGKSGFMNVDEVVPAVNIAPNAGFFQKAADMEDNDVEILHYYNRITDSYDSLANNVLIRQTPLPSRHKELPIDKWTFYPLPGQIYGLGIPQIMYSLVEERRSGRNMALDRNKMIGAGMYLVNDLFDMDEDELTPRPHGMIRVNTNGLPIQQAIQPLNYNDVPMSSMRMDDTLLTDERRAHGLDDRPAQTAGGSTATESAIISEAAQKRINLINTLQNWTTLKSIGRKKWSNIQTFYPAGREEQIIEKNEVKTKQVYKTIKIDGYEYKVTKNASGGASELVAKPYAGDTRTLLDKTFARYLEGNDDIIIDAASSIVESPAIKFQRISEMALGFLGNPITARFMDGEKTVKRITTMANERPADWMPGSGKTETEMRDLADLENSVFVKMATDGKIYMLPATPGALESHTEVHLDFINSPLYEELPEAVKAVVQQHVMGEHEKNPNTGAVADQVAKMNAPQGGEGVMPGQPGGPSLDASAGVAAPVTGGDVTAGNGPMPVA
jgi:hypothetical protein